MKTAVIDESQCIGCSLCIPACPIDSIIGARKLMHTVLIAECIGCKLCIPACPVDCITLVPLEDKLPLGKGIDKLAMANKAKQRHKARKLRLANKRTPCLPIYASADEFKQKIKADIAEIMERIKSKK